ncbi:hypothetical protein DRW48_07970 [Paracoccus suum]|uniref:Component of SufBCD complex n=1 Tax=Paracoccus suum TaxID=2259340 RepID=A0A344PJS9_9RHOB|nr:hypothetical protein [Paracoccus suum]AXC49634.1 hypothetical protein DRW48_07970 [Paracoccus suum]
MFRPDGLLSLLDTRAFTSLWYWLMLAGAWALANRAPLGVPADIVLRARRALRGGDADTPPEALVLLDWLSLCLPRWRLTPVEGPIGLAICAFGLTVLALLGFAYGSQTAQAATLLLAPLALLGAIRIGLARRLTLMLDAARRGEMPVRDAASTAAARLMRHRWLGTGLSVLAVAIATWWGVVWNLTHPNGL